MYFKFTARCCSSSGTQSGIVVVEIVAVAVLVVLVVVVVVVVLVVVAVVVVLAAVVDVVVLVVVVVVVVLVVVVLVVVVVVGVLAVLIVVVVLVVEVVVIVLIVVVVVFVFIVVVILDSVGRVVVVAVVFVGASGGQIGTPASMNSGYKSKSFSSCRIQSGSVMVGMGSVEDVDDFLGVVAVAFLAVVVDLVGRFRGLSGTGYS